MDPVCDAVGIGDAPPVVGEIQAHISEVVKMQFDQAYRAFEDVVPVEGGTEVIAADRVGAGALKSIARSSQVRAANEDGMIILASDRTVDDFTTAAADVIYGDAKIPAS